MAESFIELKQPIDPHLRRWMLFVDGENLTLRAQQLAAERQLTLSRGPTYDPQCVRMDTWRPTHSEHRSRRAARRSGSGDSRVLLYEPRRR